MPMTNPGGGASSLAQLTDVNVSVGSALDTQSVGYNFATGKWIAVPSGLPVPTVAQISTTDKSAAITLSNNNLTINSGTVANTYGARGNVSRNSGKTYFEATLSTIDNSGIKYNDVGVSDASLSITGIDGGTDDKSIVYTSRTGNVLWNNGIANTPGAAVNGDVICIALDFVNKRAWIRKNAGNWNNSGTANPATNVGGVDVTALVAKAPLFPYYQTSQGTTANILTWNFGATAFAQAVPAGFSAWDSYAPAAQTVAASPVTIAAPGRGSLVVNGGTVSQIQFQRGPANPVTLGITSGMIPVSGVNDSIIITYTVAPTVTFIPS